MTTGKFWLHQICQFVNSKLEMGVKMRAQNFDDKRWNDIFSNVEKIQENILESLFCFCILNLK